ncbi:unnamed protein product [Phytophthora lilii]|uniref:Unnamed protein product n=1 Tax=Phytophthora lilii TaxID=2077276 RepID=A0A9W6WQH7_9STRA|nr:unnamed protein product [Phytophthora lilii]
MLLFNGCSAALSAVAAVLVWAGAALAVVTLPLCGVGVAVFGRLLHVVFYLSCTDAFIYNALAASAADCIDMDLAEWGSMSNSELHPLLPIRVPPPSGGTVEHVFEPCPRFERSLGTTSPRSVLATVLHNGVWTAASGAGDAAWHDKGVQGQHSLLLLRDGALRCRIGKRWDEGVEGNIVNVLGLTGRALKERDFIESVAMPSTAAFKARGKPTKKALSCCLNKAQLLNRVLKLSRCHHQVCFACLLKACLKALKRATQAKCSRCGQEIAVDQVEIALSRSEFAQYMTQRRKETPSRVDCASCSAKKQKCELRVAPCGHYYCLPCLLRMCRLALGDRALVPLRCCKKELPDDYVREALPDSMDYAKYQRLMLEKDWKVSELESDAEYAATVKAMGAKQCPGCGIGVQRNFGCVHMTCPIGHQFCYTCLQVWGTCNCPLIPEAELLVILGE